MPLYMQKEDWSGETSPLFIESVINQRYMLRVIPSYDLLLRVFDVSSNT